MQISAPIKPPPPPKRKKRRSLMLRFIGFMFAVGGLLFIAGAAVVAYILYDTAKDLPDYEVLARYEPPVMTRIHANDGNLIAEYARERRIYVPVNTIPKKLIGAFLSAEDKNFYNHGGLDLQGIMRAVIVNVQRQLGAGGGRLVGASTITQQVAKNFLLTSKQTYTRKLQEAILAIRIERAFTKDQIIELYLNEIYFGLYSYGIAAAALNYFGKSLQELNVAEMAYLAALPKAPNNYHPFRKTKRAIARRNWVLSRMAENGYATQEEVKAAQATGLNVNPRPFGAHIFAADFFAEEVRRELFDMFGEKKLYGGGLSVRTTLDPKMQVMARKALIEGLVRFDRRKGWRGVVSKIEIADDWGKPLGDVKSLKDIQPWRLAVVLEVESGQAKIGLQPGRLKNNALEKKRETGILPLSEAIWARPINENGKRGKKIKALTQLLARGDVIYVAPREKPKPKKRKKNAPAEEIDVSGQWQLMQLPKIQGGIVALDPHTGRVHALVGGFSFAESQFDRVVQARRQPGSAFKPFVYTAALENNYTPATVVLDAPIAIEQGNGQELWRPKNYGKKFYGPSTLRLGIEKSRNLMTVRLAQDMGMPLIAEYARRFGIYDNLQPVLSMALGAGETTLLRLATAYGMLANGGRKIRATLIDRIQDRYGRTIWRHDRRVCAVCKVSEWQGQDEPNLPDTRKQIIDPHSAYQITSMLQGVVKRGTAHVVNSLGKPLAGKTGTTNEEKDAWFVGFGPDLVVGVFIGYDNPKPMGKGQTGGGVAAPIFKAFMKQALAGKPTVPFRIPPGIELYRINGKTGLRAQPGDGNTILEAFKPGTEPPDVYSVIGVQQGEGQLFIPEQDRALTSGGLY